MALVRKDEKGLFLKAGGVMARPGSINGYGHAYRMDDGGLGEGEKVTASHIGGTQMVRLKLPDGTITRWFADGATRDRGLQEPDPDAEWDKEGLRVFPVSKN